MLRTPFDPTTVQLSSFSTPVILPSPYLPPVSYPRLKLHITMPQPAMDRTYLPPIPSPLNPDSYYMIPPKITRSKSTGTRSAGLSPTQQLLRQKAAEAWRSEALRRSYSEGETTRETRRAALDVDRREGEDMPTVNLEDSLGLAPIFRNAVLDEKSRDNPFRIDLTDADLGPEIRLPCPEAARGGRQTRSGAGLTRRVLLITALLGLFFYLLPPSRFTPMVMFGPNPNPVGVFDT